MPKHREYVELLRELVCAVDDYGWIDQGWKGVATKEGTELREHMYAKAREIMLMMSGGWLDEKDIDRIFWDEE